MSNEFLLVILYVSLFLLWLPLSLWKAIKASPPSKMWRIIAVAMWGGLLMAISGKWMDYEHVRLAGALLIQAGMLLAVLKAIAYLGRLCYWLLTQKMGVPLGWRWKR